MTVDQILAPIAPLAPCGDDLSFSSDFDRIADMRRADDPSLDQGEWVTPLKQADWPGVVRHCTDLLSTRTKDLRLALWLTEAAALTEGHSGLARGLDVCAALCEAHWDGLHPLPDGGDMEERIGNIAWLLQRLVDLTPTLPVTLGRQGERHSLHDLACARQREARTGAIDGAIHGAIDGANAQPARGSGHAPPSVALIRQAMAETPAGQLRDTVAALQASATALARWQAFIDPRLGRDGPSFVAAREALAAASHDLARWLRDAGHDASGTAQGPRPSSTPAAPNGATGVLPTGDAGAMTSMPLATATPAGPPQTRQDALAQLRDVAAFFRRTEPHSPVAYLAEKAVKWGDMPLHQWLQEVVKDTGAMHHLNELLGLPGTAPHDAHRGD